MEKFQPEEKVFLPGAEKKKEKLKSRPDKKRIPKPFKWKWTQTLFLMVLFQIIIQLFVCFAHGDIDEYKQTRGHHCYALFFFSGFLLMPPEGSFKMVEVFFFLSGLKLCEFHPKYPNLTKMEHKQSKVAGGAHSTAIGILSRCDSSALLAFCISRQWKALKSAVTTPTEAQPPPESALFCQFTKQFTSLTRFHAEWRQPLRRV